LVFITGLVDDLVGLKPWQKLSGQVVAAVLAVSLGARITLFQGVEVSQWITIPLSVLWLIGCTNAFNLIDGLDGLASGVGLFATITTLLAAILQGNLGLAMAVVPLTGCLLAFLRYNFSPASIFLGDSGSLTIGFLLGCFGLIWSQKSATLLGMVAPLMALSLPLIDVCLSIGRRYLRSEPIFKGDRGHIHHMVLAMGFKPRDAALVLYGVCGIAALLSLLQSVGSYQFRGLTIILFCSLSWFGINRLGYVEFSAARRMFTQRTVLRVLQDEIYLITLKKSLTTADTVAACWQAVRKCCNDLGFASVEMCLDNETFDEVFGNNSQDASWHMTLTLGNRGHMKMARFVDSATPGCMMSVLHCLQETLRNKRLRVPDADAASMAAAGSGATYSVRNLSGAEGRPAAVTSEFQSASYKSLHGDY
jgi:UDP-GlcNAc:undecaprenyl-phosphate GlcNAc-1-phosphate transferase